MKIVVFALMAWVVASWPAKGACYWVWERSQALSPAERGQLRAAGVTQLYWQAGTLTTQGVDWRWSERFAVDWSELARDSALVVAPVLRLEPAPGLGLPEASFPELDAKLNDLVVRSGAKEIQLDYECPDRLMPNYLDFLRRLKGERTWKLSISALGHWSRFSSQFNGLVDEITPMFYDLNPHGEILSNGRLTPLFDAATAEAQILAWKGCAVPWRAGLPNFSRVTVVDEKGHNRGNIRRWTWDDLWFSPLLAASGFTEQGETVFNVPVAGILGQTPVRAGELVVIRYPDRSALQAVLPTVTEAGAEGAIYFRLAGSDDMSGFSALDLVQASSGQPAFEVTQDSAGRLTLTNRSEVDLMPMVADTYADPKARSYALVIRAEKPIWRDVVPGDFALATKEDDSAPAGDWGCRTLRFAFAHLAAGQSLQTGLVERAPDGGRVGVTWRIENGEKEGVWHELRPPVP